MKKKIRILTYHFIPNNGAALFALSLSRALADCFEGWDVKILGYKAPKLFGYDLLKLGKPLPNYPFFYLQRHAVFQNFFEQHLDIDRDAPEFSGGGLMRYLNEQEVAATVVAMDTWNVSKWKDLPAFPNVYWLPGKLSGKKVAISISGYRSHKSELKRHHNQMKQLLSDFAFIGVRDALTQAMIDRTGVASIVPVERMHDATIFHEIESVGVKQKLMDLGVDFDRPILGLLYFGQPGISKAIRAYFKDRGFQIVALSMYNRYADINLGHRLDPLEWAEAFRFLSFCITDRFHGALYCLKNKTPFISIEPTALESPLSSKLFDLLGNFGMEAFYVNPFSEAFVVENIFEKYEFSKNVWEESVDQIGIKLEMMRQENLGILQRVKAIIGD